MKKLFTFLLLIIVAAIVAIQAYYYFNYFDEATINGTAVIGGLPYNYYFYETADTAIINKRFSNLFNLYDPGQTRFITGDCSVDFDSLYINGGGAFSGTIKIISGSAYVDCQNMVPDLPPLQVTGSLNGTAKTITMKLKGKMAL